MLESCLKQLLLRGFCRFTGTVSFLANACLISNLFLLASVPEVPKCQSAKV